MMIFICFCNDFYQLRVLQGGKLLLCSVYTAMRRECGNQPLIWRLFLVTDDYRFDRFHQVVFLVMGWMNSHLHEFDIGERKIGDYAYHLIIIHLITISMASIRNWRSSESGIASIRGRRLRLGTRYEKKGHNMDKGIKSRRFFFLKKYLVRWEEGRR
jgi:hypothetical protein